MDELYTCRYRAACLQCDFYISEPFKKTRDKLSSEHVVSTKHAVSLSEV